MNLIEYNKQEHNIATMLIWSWNMAHCQTDDLPCIFP